jgi:DNA invertase Pin-like site-specific DNA recombinase
LGTRASEREGLCTLRAEARRRQIDVVLVASAHRLTHHLAEQTVLRMEFNRLGMAVQAATSD